MPISTEKIGQRAWCRLDSGGGLGTIERSCTIITTHAMAFRGISFWAFCSLLYRYRDLGMGLHILSIYTGIASRKNGLISRHCIHRSAIFRLISRTSSYFSIDDLSRVAIWGRYLVSPATRKPPLTVGTICLWRSDASPINLTHQSSSLPPSCSTSDQCMQAKPHNNVLANSARLGLVAGAVWSFFCR